MRRAEPEDPTGGQLTDRQRRIMQVIEESVRRHGYPPTLREIGDAAGLASTSSVSHQLISLRRRATSRGAGPARR
jgi:repressor LexA